MTKHYVFSLNPSAEYEWERCTLRDPITTERPDLASLVAEAVGNQPGAYLVEVKVEVKVLEQAPLAQAMPVMKPRAAMVPPAAERVA
ncbi:hypothetical protein [Geitlerinema sp. PCC 7407]|uniref:hypothetical protein n=1 Tax=Geitlerinema sp. PCC 7407 TaxID=1173025 RepID=UPI00029FAF80|nr:hypothetical protein [Geitlerinema sp. PCC 7407]AFY64534.1 hypothetical protein GEI7407_0028 [Geitlerinema sp. PCC 7407]